MASKVKESIRVRDAMANLQAIVSIDLDAIGPIAILGKYRLVTSQEEFNEETEEWLSSEGPEPILEILDTTFDILSDYIEKKQHAGEEDDIVSTILELAGEATRKLEKVLAFKLGRTLDVPFQQRSSFLRLKEFYTQASPEPDRVDAMALQNFDAVRSDREYELFF